MVQLVSPLQAEDGRLTPQSVASQLWDVLQDRKDGASLGDIINLVGLSEGDVQPVR